MGKLINITEGLAPGESMVTQAGTAKIGTGTKVHRAERQFNPTTKVAGTARVYCNAGESRGRRNIPYVHGFITYDTNAKLQAAVTCGSCK